MKSRKILNLIAIAILAISISGCKKDEQPQMEINSELYTIYNWNWDEPYHYKEINIPEITKNVIDNGAILVYLKIPNSDIYYQIPSSWAISEGISIYFELSIEIGKIQIEMSSSNQEFLSPYPMTFKVVVIEGNQLKLNPDVDLKNYNEVIQTFNIID